MRTVEEVFSACGAYRLVRIQEVRVDAIVQHAVLDRAADGAVVLDLTDPGCRVDAAFFDAAAPTLSLCAADLDALLARLPPVGSPSDVVRTFGGLELAPRRRCRVLRPIPDGPCRDLPSATW